MAARLLIDLADKFHSTQLVAARLRRRQTFDT